MTSPAAGFKRVLGALAQLKIAYMVGGSLASSIHGISRSTHDVDLVADFRPEHIQPFCAHLTSEFYADSLMMQEALRHGREFNVIHLGSSYKFDIYPLSQRPYDQAAFARRMAREYAFEGEALSFDVASPEDTVLAKLVWYRMGGQVSERQWAEVLDVIRVQRERLDRGYPTSGHGRSASRTSSWKPSRPLNRRSSRRGRPAR